MAFVVQPQSKQNFAPKLVAMCPYNIFMYQVQGALDNIRFSSQGMDYISPQMGGLEGQRQVTEEALVIQAITFEVD